MPSAPASEDLTAPAAVPIEPSPSRRAGLLLSLGLVVLIAALMVTFLVFTTDDGADSAEGSARAMMAALQDGDLLGTLAQLPPGERRALADDAAALVAPLQRLGLLGPIDPGHLANADLSFQDVRMTTTELGKDVQAIDLVGGSFAATLPAGDAALLTAKARTLLEQNGIQVDAGGTYHRDFTTDPLRVVAIREGGGWHISLAYSVAEALRQRAGVEAPKMGTGPPAIGADTPADAVRDLVSAYADGNPGRILELAYPDEARALYDYAPLFLPQSRDAAKAAAAGTFDVQLNQLTTEVGGAGPVRTVQVTGLDLDIRDEVKKTHVTYDGRCLHTDQRIRDEDSPYRKSDACDGDWGTDDPATRVRDNPVANLAVFGGGADLPTFTVVERNGRWFVSPVRTVLDSLVRTLDQLPADKVDVFVDRLAASWRAGAGAGISGTPPVDPLGADATDDERRVAHARQLVDACGHLLDPPAPPAPSAPGADLRPVPEAADPLTDPLTFSCVAYLVATQRVDPADLPTELRQRVTA